MWLWWSIAAVVMLMEHCDCAHSPPPSRTKYASLPSTSSSSTSDQPVINNQSTRLDCHSMSSVNASEQSCDTLLEMIVTLLCSNCSMPIVDSVLSSSSKQFNNLPALVLISDTNVTWVDLCLMNGRMRTQESSSSKQTTAKFEPNQVVSRRATVNYNRINIVNDHHHSPDSEPNEFQGKRDLSTTPPPVPMAGANQEQNLPGPGTSKRCIGLAACSEPNHATGPLASSNDNQSQAIVKFCLLVTVANCSRGRSAGTTNQTQPNRDSSCYNAARATINQTSTSNSSSHTQNIALLQCQLQSFRANTRDSSDSMQPVHCPLSSPSLASHHNCNRLATLKNSTSTAGKCRLVHTNGTCIHWLSSEQFNSNHSCLFPPMSGSNSKRPLGNVILILSLPGQVGPCLLGFVECTKCDLNVNRGADSEPVQSVEQCNHINMLIESLNKPIGHQSMTIQGKRKPKRPGFVLNKSIVVATGPTQPNHNDQNQSEAPSPSGEPVAFAGERTMDSMAPSSSSSPPDTVRHVYSGESMVHHQLEWPSPIGPKQGPNSLFNQILDVGSDRAVSGGVNGAEPKQLNTDTATKLDQFTRNQTSGWNVNNNNNNNRGSNYHKGPDAAKPVRCLHHHHLNQSDPHSSLFDIINFNQSTELVDRPPIRGLPAAHANHRHASLQSSVPSRPAEQMPVAEALVASPSLVHETSENMSEFSQLSGLVLSRDPDRSTLLSRFPSLKLPPPPPEFADEFNEGKAHWPVHSGNKCPFSGPSVLLLLYSLST